jgi:hypothetical protein
VSVSSPEQRASVELTTLLVLALGLSTAAHSARLMPEELAAE